MLRRTIAVLALGALAGCPPMRPSAPRPAPPPDAGPRVQKVRDDLQVTPLEAVFSGVRGDGESEESVAIRNTGTTPIQISGVEVVGEGAAPFKITTAPAWPVTLIPATQLSVSVSFAPSHDETAGVHRAMLKVFLGPEREEGPPVDLSGLVLAGRRGDKEPTLQVILDALGFAVDVGRADLHLGLGAEPLGDEVAVGRFRKAGGSSVSLYPVARFAAGERQPYGYYDGEGGPQPHPLGAVAAEQDQKLNPELEPDAQTTFDPGAGTFGIFVNLGRRYGYSEDRMNTGPVRHAARVYPLKSRTGARLPNAYAIAFESSGDGDYQDLVFLLWNAKAAEP